jgi:NAD(P)-dependent dehydrogenase (short-subunit alcohol dehydrogenase family)
VLVNNADVGSPATSPPWKTGWDAFFGVDLKGAWLTAKYAVPQMRELGGRSIINISSIHAHLTRACSPTHVKAGMLGLTRSMALDLAADRIRIYAPENVVKQLMNLRELTLAFDEYAG